MIPAEYYVLLSALLFVVGGIGFLVRRNVLVTLMSIEVMLNAANLALVAFARQWGEIGGQLIVFFVITVAAAEVAVGLARQSERPIVPSAGRGQQNLGRGKGPYSHHASHRASPGGLP